MPLTTIRIVVDINGKDVSESLTHAIINKHQEPVPPEVATKIVKTHKDEIRKLIQHSERLSMHYAPNILATAQEHTHQLLQREIGRLKALQQVNPNVRNEEIDYFEQQYRHVSSALESSSPRLDALRIIVST